MASDSKTRNEADAAFSFGVRELRRARTAQNLRVEDAPLRAVSENRGSILTIPRAASIARRTGPGSASASRAVAT